MRKKIEQTSSFQGELVKYYDNFFLKEEHLEKEIAHIQRLILEYGNWKGKISILDVGCGTGAHDFKFAKNGYKVKGIDVSDDMIAFSKSRVGNEDGLEFECCNIQQVCFSDMFEVCISLSHVIGYQLKNEDVEGMLQNISKSLKTDGIFIFNFYNIAGILQNGLRAQKKEVLLEDGRILRFSNAEMDLSQSELNLEYYYLIDDGDSHNEIEINEKIRCFSKKELQYYLEKNGFKVVKMYNYMEDSIGESWNCGVICKKS